MYTFPVWIACVWCLFSFDLIFWLFCFDRFGCGGLVAYFLFWVFGFMCAAVYFAGMLVALLMYLFSCRVLCVFDTVAFVVDVLILI